MADLIDRRAVLEDTKSWVGLNWYEQRLQRNVIEWLQGFPSAQQWVPVADRLPDTEDEVIVSIHDDSGDTPYDYTACGWKLLAVEDNAWIVDNEVHYNIIAWSPLPEPWKGER